ncbi:hypothetical protein ACFQ0M_35485 [Kitasatospora aburaviensis]
MTASTTQWPAVRPEVVAEVVAGLSARLQKRLDGAAAKLADRPVERTGDDWRIAVDEETELLLHAPGGVVGDPAGVRCGCLLAPACVHRAAAVTVCRLTDADADADADIDTDAETDAADGDSTAADAADPAAAAEAAVAGDPGSAPVQARRRAAPSTGEPADPPSPAERAAVHHLHHAAAAVLAAGVGGTGAVLQAELLRAAHRARLAGLHRPAAAAVAVVTRVRAARSGEPDHRLADLAAGLRELLDLTTALTAVLTTAPATSPATSPALPPGGLAELRGSARQAYHEAGGLRLYGLFTEPVLTATHAGVLTWAVDAGGRLSTVAEVMPHADATAAAPRPSAPRTGRSGSVTPCSATASSAVPGSPSRERPGPPTGGSGPVPRCGRSGRRVRRGRPSRSRHSGPSRPPPRWSVRCRRRRCRTRAGRPGATCSSWTSRCSVPHRTGRPVCRSSSPTAVAAWSSRSGRHTTTRGSPSVATWRCSPPRPGCGCG